MPFHPAPALPPRLAPLLACRRGLYELERGGLAGLELHYVDQGSRTQPTIVLLHGNATWCFLWRSVIAGLDAFRCIAPDLLGFGLSERLRTVEAHRLERHGDALVELLDALGVAECILVAQDAAGAIAADVGRKLGPRVRGIVLSNTWILGQVGAPARRSWTERIAGTPGLGELALQRLGLPMQLLWAVQRDRRSLRGAVAAAYRWPLRHPEDRVGMLALARWPHATGGDAAWQQAEAWLRGFSGPITLFWGRHDPLTIARLAAHQSALPHAHVTLCNAGHWIQEEAPEAFATAIRDTVRQLEPAPATPVR